MTIEERLWSEIYKLLDYAPISKLEDDLDQAVYEQKQLFAQELPISDKRARRGFAKIGMISDFATLSLIQSQEYDRVWSFVCSYFQSTILLYKGLKKNHHDRGAEGSWILCLNELGYLMCMAVHLKQTQVAEWLASEFLCFINDGFSCSCSPDESFKLLCKYLASKISEKNNADSSLDVNGVFQFTGLYAALNDIDDSIENRISNLMVTRTKEFLIEFKKPGSKETLFTDYIFINMLPFEVSAYLMVHELKVKINGPSNFDFTSHQVLDDTRCDFNHLYLQT